jgi:hypothetical protein
MTEVYEKIADRVPRFYRAWDFRSNMASLITAIGKSLGEQNKDLFGIMRSHWIDSAFAEDLDLLASLFRLKRRKNESDESFRVRIKYFIVEFLGGGTKEAILAQARLFLGVRESYPEVDLIENPPIEQVEERTVKNGEIWTMKSRSIYDELFSLEFRVEKGKNELLNPKIEDLENKSSITFNGIMKSEQKLLLSENGEAKLDGKSVTKRVNNTGLKILRTASQWAFTESTSPMIGKFDEAVFDTHMFETSVPTASVSIRWTARLLSAFELRVLRSALERSGVTEDELRGMVDMIKAAGIKSFITVADKLDVSSPDREAGRVANK